MNYFEMYELMYQHGYRAKRRCAGAAFLHYAHDLLRFRTALDVGCGWGEAVNWLSKHCERACGVDVSITATQDAQSKGLAVQLASIMDLPYENDEFECVFSSDVIEHLEPEDVDAAITECLRVASKYVVLQIAVAGTKNRWSHVTGVDQIHLTQRSFSEWSEYFKQLPLIRVAFTGCTKHHVMFILCKRNGIENRLTFYSKLYNTLCDAGLKQARKSNGSAFINKLCAELQFMTVLDVGAGKGGDCLTLKKHKKQPTAVEVSEEALSELAAREIDFVKASATDLPFTSSSFDLVVAIDFMEHLREEDVSFALEEMYRVTKRYVALQIGTAKAKARGPSPSEFGYQYDNIHLTIWPPKKWSRRLKKAGFSIVDATVSRPDNQRGHTHLFYVILEKVNG